MRDKSSTPKRFETLRFNPLRAILPWIATAVGLSMASIGAFTLGSGAGGGVLFLAMGSVLTAVGIGAFFLFRWMARRGV